MLILMGVYSDHHLNHMTTFVTEGSCHFDLREDGPTA